MVPLQPFMNQLGGGYYPTGQGHGIYQNPGFSAISQTQYFPGAWAQMPQPQTPFSGHAKSARLVKIDE
jgi:hypothetical protein